MFAFWHRLRFRGTARTLSRRHRRRTGPRKRCLPLRLEVLEDRLVPATFVVNTTADVLGHTGGQESLRQAILDSNATPSTAAAPNVIVFDLSAGDPNHFYYKNDGVAGQVSLAQKTNTTAAADGQISDIDPDWAHSWWVITPTSPLPALTAPVILDGYSQPGASANTLAVGDNAVLNVQIDGSLLPANTATLPNLGAVPCSPVLTVAGGGSTVEGLNIDGLLGNGGGVGVWLIDNGGNRVSGNFIGTDISGTLAPNGLPNYAALSAGPSYGVSVSDGSCDNVIGTDGDGANDPAERNVISANNWGVLLRGYVWSTGAPGAQLSQGNVIAGNYIGTDRTGTKALGNWTGIGTEGQACHDRIGTNGTDVDAAGEGNVISGNACGIMLGAGYFSAADASHDYLIAGNSVGVNVAGQALGNRDCGIFTDVGFYNAQIGGATAVMANVLADNGGPGVWVTDHRANSYNIDVQGNSIYNDANLGINIGGVDFPTPDPVLLNNSQGHSGPNLYQNFPVLTAAANSPAGVVLQGTLSANPATAYTIQFYANAAEDASGYGAGQTYLGSAQVRTDANGNVTFTSPSFTLPSGEDYLSATATDPNGNTSEFARDFVVPAADAGGPYAIASGAGVTLNASASVSPDGAPLTYTWTINGHAGAASGVQPTLSWAQLAALGVGPGATYALGVHVDNGEGGSADSAPAALTVAMASGGQGVQPGQTATIGYWQQKNPNGTSLLNQYNDAIRNFLATTFPDLYGASAGANNLLSQASANVSNFYEHLFTTQKNSAQVMSTALALFFTNQSFNGNPFAPIPGGLGAATFDVSSFVTGQTEQEFGVTTNTTVTVLSLLQAVDQHAVQGVLYGGNGSLQNVAGAIFQAINKAGDIGSGTP